MSAVQYDENFDRKIEESVELCIKDLKIEDNPLNRQKIREIARLTLLTHMKIEAEVKHR